MPHLARPKSGTLEYPYAAEADQKLEIRDERSAVYSESRNPVSASPDRIDQSSVRVDQSPVRVDQSPVRVDQSPVRVDQSPVRVDQSPVRVDQSPVRVDQSPVQVDRSPVQVDRSPVQVDRSPVRVNRSPVQVDRSPVRVKRAKVLVDPTPGLAGRVAIFLSKTTKSEVPEAVRSDQGNGVNGLPKVDPTRVSGWDQESTPGRVMDPSAHADGTDLMSVRTEPYRNVVRLRRNSAPRLRIGSSPFAVRPNA